LQPSDKPRLRHMLEAARQALSFISGRKRPDLDEDRMLTFAVLRCLEIVGEAAAKVSSDTRTRYGAIPWTDTVGMRNWLIHAYFDINLDRIWDTVTDDIPALITELEKILQAEGTS